MMLAMRKHLKKLSLTLWLVIAAFIGTIFLVWGAGRRGFRAGKDIVATVNGEKISYDEFSQAVRRYADYYRQKYQDRLTAEMLESLDIENQALQDLIERRLLLQEASKQGILVTDDEVMAQIRQNKYFQDEHGRFNPQKYLQVLSMSRIAPERYEEGIRRNRMITRLLDLVRSTVRVTDDEVREKFRQANEKVKCCFVEFKSEDFAKKLRPTEKQLSDFYEQHKEEYKSQREVSVEYIAFDSEDFKPKVTVAADEIHDYYDEHHDEYVKPEQVRARHILVKVAQDASPQLVKKAKEKIEKVMAELKAGADFAELAKKYSDCPSSAKGGDLGYFSRGQMVKPFEDAAFSLKVGQTSGIVRTRFGFHIIKVEDHKDATAKSLGEVRDEIEARLVDQKALDLAKAAAERAAKAIKKPAELAKFAASHGLALRQTGFFKRFGKIEGIGRSREFANAAFSLAKDAVSPPVKAGNRYYIMRLKDERPPIVQPLDQVKDRVKKDWLKLEGEKLARARAYDFASRAKTVEALKSLAKKSGLKVKETDYFTRLGFVRGIGMSKSFTEAAFSTDVGHVAGPVEVRDRYVVFAPLDHTQFSEEEFDKQKDEIARQIRMQKEDEALRAWLTDLKNKAEIYISSSFKRARASRKKRG